MTKKVIPLGIALVICTIFLLLVLSPGGCAFDLLPYLIHEGMSKGGGGESQFVVGFDILFAVAAFLIVYKIARIVLLKSHK
jgi:small-conductance mechanosensitive channel